MGPTTTARQVAQTSDGESPPKVTGGAARDDSRRNVAAPLVRLHRAPWRVVAARIIVNGLAVALVVLILPGVRESTGHPLLGYLLLGAIFGLVNAFVKPVVQFVALPLLAGSMGLVIVLVDIATFAVLDAVTKVIQTSGAVSVIVGGVVLGLLSYLLDNLVGLTPPIVPDLPEKV